MVLFSRPVQGPRAADVRRRARTLSLVQDHRRLRRRPHGGVPQRLPRVRREAEREAPAAARGPVVFLDLFLGGIYKLDLFNAAYQRDNSPSPKPRLNGVFEGQSVVSPTILEYIAADLIKLTRYMIPRKTKGQTKKRKFWSRHPEGEVPARTALTPSVRTSGQRRATPRGARSRGVRSTPKEVRVARGCWARPFASVRARRSARSAPRGRLKPASWRAGRTARKPQPPSQPPPGDRGGRWQRSRTRSGRSVVARVTSIELFRRLAHDG